MEHGTGEPRRVYPARAAGVEVFLATGRAAPEAAYFAQEAGCGVLAALAGLCAASGAACVFALTPGWRVWALPVFFLLALAGAACGLLLYAAGSALQILCDIRGAVKDKLR